uniref:Uncharacterized protein n=1 Tax=Fusarium oxysporum (strain Fo5176) TaxID=660025 RepID=A0A0D2XTC9_FUSOF
MERGGNGALCSLDIRADSGNIAADAGGRGSIDMLRGRSLGAGSGRGSVSGLALNSTGDGTTDALDGTGGSTRGRGRCAFGGGDNAAGTFKGRGRCVFDGGDLASLRP